MSHELPSNDEYYGWYNRSEALRMKYPSELVVGFLAGNLRVPGRTLDQGCGSGRHVILAAELGHQAHGVDLSDSGFGTCRRIADERGLAVKLRQARMESTGFADGFFDAIVCISSVGGNTLQGQHMIVRECQRILRTGGILLMNFYGLKDGLYRELREHAQEVEERTLAIPGELFHPGQQEAVPTYLRHFSTEAELTEMFASFSVQKHFQIYLPYGNCKFSSAARAVDHLYVMARK